MNKFDELLNRFSSLNIDINDYVIFGSGPMVIRGIREPKDLDVVLRKKVWDTWAIKDGWISRDIRPGEHYLESDTCQDVELYEYWGPGEWSTEQIIANSEIIDGYRYASMEDEKRYKTLCGREKDLKDLELIKDYESKL